MSLDAVEQPYSVNSRYNFSNRGDHEALAHSITSLPATAMNYTAIVTPEFKPAANFNYPPCGGSATLSPVSSTKNGSYPTAQQLSYETTPDTAWVFAGWTYDITGPANPARLTTTDETLVYANFITLDVPLMVTGTSPATASVGGSAFKLTLTGTGVTSASSVSANGQYRTVTYVNSSTLTTPLNPADIATTGAFKYLSRIFRTAGLVARCLGIRLLSFPGADHRPPLWSFRRRRVLTPRRRA